MRVLSNPLGRPYLIFLLQKQSAHISKHYKDNMVYISKYYPPMVSARVHTLTYLVYISLIKNLSPGSVITYYKHSIYAIHLLDANMDITIK